MPPSKTPPKIKTGGNNQGTIPWQQQPTITPDDERYGGRYLIKNNGRMWDSDRLDKYQKDWEQDQHDFGQFRDVVNGKPVKSPLFGGQEVYRMTLKNGTNAFVKQDPTNPGQMIVKAEGVAEDDPEGKWHPLPIRPGSEDLGPKLAAVRNATDPQGNQYNLRKGNAADIESAFNNLQFSKESNTPENQAKAQAVSERFQRGLRVDQAYADAEKQLKILGPDKVKELTDWAHREGYVTSKLTEDQQHYYAYLNALAHVINAGLSTGSNEAPQTQASQAATTVAGISFIHPLQGVKDVIDQLITKTDDPYGVATNIHKERLQNMQDTVNNLGIAVNNNPSLAVSPTILAEARIAGHNLDKVEKIAPYESAMEKAKTIWDIKKEEDAANTPPSVPGERPDAPQAEPASSVGEKSTTFDEEGMHHPLVKPKDAGQAGQPQVGALSGAQAGTGVTQTGGTQTGTNQKPLGIPGQGDEGANIQKGGRIVGDWLNRNVLGGRAESVVMPAPLPEQKIETPRILGGTVQQPEEDTTLQLHPATPSATPSATPAASPSATPVTISKVPRSWNPFQLRSREDLPPKPQEPPAVSPNFERPTGYEYGLRLRPAPIKGAQSQADANPPSEGEVGNYVPDIPTLAHQDHVDALQPGQPFQWHDGQTYVKV